MPFLAAWRRNSGDGRVLRGVRIVDLSQRDVRAGAVHADTFTRRYVLYDRLAQSRVRHHLPQSANHLALLANNLISNRELEMEFHIFHSHEPVLR